MPMKIDPKHMAGVRQQINQRMAQMPKRGSNPPLGAGGPNGPIGVGGPALGAGGPNGLIGVGGPALGAGGPNGPIGVGGPALGAGGVGQFTNQPGMMPTKMAKGGSVSGASRGDGCAQRGKTKGKVV